MPSFAHPVDVLVAEHEVISAVLDAMQREVQRTASGGELKPRFWLDVAAFLECFADHCHHAKEEDLLFPALQACGMSEMGGPIGVMKHEHVDGRALRQRLHEAARAERADEIMEAARSFVFLLRGHIEKENTVLFPIARDLLPPERVEELCARFAEADRTEPEQSPCLWLERAEALCTETGVSLPAAAEELRAAVQS